MLFLKVYFKEWKNSTTLYYGSRYCRVWRVFKVTDGFLNKFGKDRVRNTPLCESAIVGAALGLSLKEKAIMEMQFADFVTVGFNQIVNNLAKLDIIDGGKMQMLYIRMPTGAGVGAGPFHSQSNEAWFSYSRTQNSLPFQSRRC